MPYVVNNDISILISVRNQLLTKLLLIRIKVVILGSTLSIRANKLKGPLNAIVQLDVPIQQDLLLRSYSHPLGFTYTRVNHLYVELGQAFL